MRLKTRLTERFKMAHPIVLAPMGGASGARLASAVSRAGGLGLIGGGYGDIDYISSAFNTSSAPVGCGLIAWSADKHPALIDEIIRREPRAVFLSFGVTEALIARFRGAGVPVMMQCQTLEDVDNAVRWGAEVIVAQGGESGGHGRSVRSTLPFVTEAVQLLRGTSTTPMLLAAGGISDGRSLAAMLMLGADGVVMGTRFWAAHEADVDRNAHEYALARTGDNTCRTRRFDEVEQYGWPEYYDARYLRNAFLEKWETAERSPALTAIMRDEYLASRADDFNTRYLALGESIGCIKSLDSAERIIDTTINEAVKSIMESGNLLADK